MSRRWQTLFFAAGAAIFIYLVHHVGLRALVTDAARTGWMIVPVIGVYAVVYLTSAWAWQLIMGGEPRRPPFWRTYAYTVSGFAINAVTPMANAGGEPFRIAAVSSWLGTRRAAGTVVLFVMVHALGHVLMFLTGLALALTLVHTAVPVGVLLAVTAVCAGVGFFLLSRHRQGFLERLLDLLHRMPLGGGLARRLEGRRPTLVRLDQQITSFYHESPGRFWRALGIEYLGRCIAVLELWFIAFGVGLHMTYREAYVLATFSAMITNVLFLVPLEIGSKEGGMFVVFRALGRNPAMGVTFALVSRVREMFWIGTGLALIWISGPVTEEVNPVTSGS